MSKNRRREFGNVLAFNRGLAAVAIVISGGALLVDVRTCSSSEEQFRKLNEGHLLVEVSVGVKHNFSVEDKGKMNLQQRDTAKISGLSYGLVIQNVGNLPLSFNVTKFQVFMQGTMAVDKKNNPNQVIHPGEETLFRAEDGFVFEPMAARELRKSDIKVKYTIEYWNLEKEYPGKGEAKKVEGHRKVIIHTPFWIGTRAVGDG